jgi:hypothetical protein
MSPKKCCLLRIESVMATTFARGRRYFAGSLFIKARSSSLEVMVGALVRRGTKLGCFFEGGFLSSTGVSSNGGSA